MPIIMEDTFNHGGFDVENSVNGNNYVDSSSSRNGNRRKLLIFGIAIAAITISAAITIPIVVINRRNGTSSNTSDNANAAALATSSRSNNSNLATDSLMNSKYNSSSGPFNVSIERLSGDVVNGYKDDDDLQQSISNAVNFYLFNLYKQYNNSYVNGSATNRMSPRSGTKTSATTKVNDFGTRNQELGIEEGDTVVSDGNYVYAAYGKYIVILNKETGAMLKTIEMPTINVTYPDYSWFGNGYGTIPPSDVSTSNDYVEPLTRGNATTVPSDFSTSYDYYDSGYYWPTEPAILSLLLHDGRLLVLLYGYGEMLKEKTETGDYKNVLSDYLSTRIRVYDTETMVLSSDSDPGLLASTDVNGGYTALRSSNGIVQIVTTSCLNTGSYLTYPLQNMLQDNSIDDQEFANAAASLNDNFTIQLLSDLQALGRQTPNLFRINLYSDSTTESSLNELAYSNGVLNALALVHTVDLASNDMNATLGNITSSGAFLPSYYFQVYGTTEKILVAAEVYLYDNNFVAYNQSTALVVFSANGTTTNPYAVGTVPGAIMSPYSLDIVGDTVRVATTVSHYVESTLAPSDLGTQAPSDLSTDWMLEGTFTPPDTENYVIVMQMPDGANAGLMVELGRVQVGKPKESFTSVRFLDQVAYVMTFFYVDPFYVIDLSDPTNPKAIGELEVQGVSNYMYPINENKTLYLAIGSATDVNGTTTGLQLTMLDVSVPTTPVVQYRHVIDRPSKYSSISSDSFWDPKSTRFSNGYLFLSVDIDDYYSSVTYNATSISSTSPSSSFHGTMVFTVDPLSGINEKPACRIPYDQPSYYDTYMEYQDYYSTQAPTTEPKQCNYTGGYLPRRSMVFGDYVMSTSYSEYILTNFDTCERVWNNTIGIAANCTSYMII